MSYLTALLLPAILLAGEPVPPKYKVPNEFTMRDGCVIRVIEKPEYWQCARIEGAEWTYHVDAHLNDWSNECSMADDFYLESDIMKARYK
jgi:hypothetical protein